MDSKLMIPASIIIAAIVIAGALFMVNNYGEQRGFTYSS